MNEHDEVCIKRIKDEINFILNTMKVIDKNIFLNNRLFQHAITMSLVIIGENINHLSQEFKKEYSQIEWVQVVAVTIASQGYWQLNMSKVWKAVETDITKLKTFFDEF